MRCLPLFLLGLGLSLALPASAQTTDPAGPGGTATGAGTSGGSLLPPTPNSGRNVSATGRVMPPTTGRTPGALTDPLAPNPTTATGGSRRSRTATGKEAAKAGSADKGAARSPNALRTSTEAEMVKAQKAAETRNKAWDERMRKTMSSICSGC